MGLPVGHARGEADDRRPAPVRPLVVLQRREDPLAELVLQEGARAGQRPGDLHIGVGRDRVDQAADEGAVPDVLLDVPVLVELGVAPAARDVGGHPGVPGVVVDEPGVDHQHGNRRARVVGDLGHGRVGRIVHRHRLVPRARVHAACRDRDDVVARRDRPFRPVVQLPEGLQRRGHPRVAGAGVPGVPDLDADDAGPGEGGVGGRVAGGRHRRGQAGRADVRGHAFGVGPPG